MAYSSANSQHLVRIDESSSSLTGVHHAQSSTYGSGGRHVSDRGRYMQQRGGMTHTVSDTPWQPGVLISLIGDT